MEILVIDRPLVRRLLPMEECVQAMREALASLARGECVQPLRSIMWLPGKKGALGLMPGYTGRPSAAGVKVVTVFPGNHGTEYDSHQGAVLLFDSDHGHLLALAEAGEITAIRTAAVSAVATDLLAKEEAGDLALLGSGVQARQHLEAMSCVRSLRRVRVWSPTRDHCEEFASRLSGRFGCRVETVTGPREAVEGADLICTTTFASEPVLKGEWLVPGAHINAVGSSLPTSRELDTLAVLRSRLFVDRLESTLNEAGDFLIPKKEGVIGDEHIQGEIGDILEGKTGGRGEDHEITLFKSLGLAVEDVQAIEWIYRKALEQGVGVKVPFGGSKDAS
ncbi:MAG TPA: ornithine cyclodeaminase family protein [Acidobacteriota bacterium]|nr:ornithine cyclodeaminase family protein [Acidobacteriota bacterium]